jgi:hypothetical protein
MARYDHPPPAREQEDDVAAGCGGDLFAAALDVGDGPRDGWP